MYASVQIIIPCLNEEQFIGKCLDSVFAAERPAGGIQVSVAEGRSSDNTLSILKAYQQKFPELEILDNPKRVTPIAMNLGLEASKCDAFVILGAHATIDKEFLVRGLKHLNDNEELGCVGGFVENVYLNSAGRAIGKAMKSPFGVGNAHYRTGTAVGYVDTVLFGMYPRKLVEEIGPFDPVLVRNQDDEFNYRVNQSGKKILLDPAIKASYYVRGSLKKLYLQHFQYGYWKVYVNTKHKAITTLRQLAPPLLVFGLLLGWVLGVFLPIFSALYLLLWFVYLALGGILSLRASKGVREMQTIWLAFLALHFGYGLGYLKGLIFFYFGKRKPSSDFEVISR